MMMKMTTMKKTSVFLCLLSAVISMISIVNSSNEIFATCTMNSLNQTNKTVQGLITLRQTGGGNTTITGFLTGFTWGGNHGFHIHEYGNLSNSCDAAGAHYNPYNTTHGPQNANSTMRHVGDLGNIDVDANLTANFTIIDSIIQLQGNYSVLGRAMVVHSGVDDLGKGNSVLSNTTGNSGFRIGCCLIEISNATTTAPVNVSSTTHGPSGSAVSVGPLVAVSAACVAAVQLILSLG